MFLFFTIVSTLLVFASNVNKMSENFKRRIAKANAKINEKICRPDSFEKRVWEWKSLSTDEKDAMNTPLRDLKGYAFYLGISSVQKFTKENKYELVRLILNGEPQKRKSVSFSQRSSVSSRINGSDSSTDYSTTDESSADEDLGEERRERQEQVEQREQRDREERRKRRKKRKHKDLSPIVSTDVSTEISKISVETSKPKEASGFLVFGTSVIVTIAASLSLLNMFKK